jgi:hypothetical protein
MLKTNLWMERTRVAPVKGTRNARTSLAFLAPCEGQLRAVHLGRYTFLSFDPRG